MSSFAWGSEETKFFFDLTPEKILDAVEASGLRCTGRVLTLNSMENRVYEVEIEVDDPKALKSPSDKFRVVKFYRPGRWSQAQILEEHEFLKDLIDAEIPVVAPVPFADGSTLRKVEGVEIWYALFKKIGGRNPDELTVDQGEQIGRLLARLHLVGAKKPAPHRVVLNLETYGKQNLKYLVDSKALPLDLKDRYVGLVDELCRVVEPWFKNVPMQRIHGDCHLGNLLWGTQGPFFVDFDDMVTGPCVQDIWLLNPGRDENAQRVRDQMLEGYEQFRTFPYETLKLVEPLRALRFIHFSAWIAKRWHDPAFTRTFTQFGTPRYWQEQVLDLQEQMDLIHAMA